MQSFDLKMTGHFRFQFSRHRPQPCERVKHHLDQSVVLAAVRCSASNAAAWIAVPFTAHWATNDITSREKSWIESGYDILD